MLQCHHKTSTTTTRRQRRHRPPTTSSRSVDSPFREIPAASRPTRIFTGQVRQLATDPSIPDPRLKAESIFRKRMRYKNGFSAWKASCFFVSSTEIVVYSVYYDLCGIILPINFTSDTFMPIISALMTESRLGLKQPLKPRENIFVDVYLTH